LEIPNCPLCEKIKREKINLYKSFSKDFFPPLCKEHFKEVCKVIDTSFISWDNFSGEENCFVCEFERKIEEEFYKNNIDYSELCLYHLKKVRDKLTPKDYEKLVLKWERFREMVIRLIESYDYNSEKITFDDFYLILDHLLGTGKRI